MSAVVAGDTVIAAADPRPARGWPRPSPWLVAVIAAWSWFGLAASLGMTALSALRDPRLLLGRIDDLAQDVESAQLIESVWQVIDQTARSRGAGTALSDRLSRTVCPYCQTANPVASGRCLACGAPLGGVQPHTCPQCGFALLSEENTCPNCGAVLQN